MSVPKIKSERYQNFGGINNKISQYDNSPLEFLDIANFDFQTPGALTQRWGSTQYVGQTVSGAITGLFEYAQTGGFSQVIFSATGGIWAGATTGNSQGLSLTNVGVTTVYTGRFLATTFAAGSVLNLSGTGYLVNNDLATLLRFGTAAGNGNTFYIAPQTHDGSNLDIEELVNEAFIASSSKFLKYNGITTSVVSLPPVGLAAGPTSSINMFLPMGPVYFAAASYVNDRGFEGPVWPVFTTDATTISGTTMSSTGQGTTFVYYKTGYNAHTPLALGISSINVYLYAQSASVGGFGSSAFSYNYTYVANFPASGSTLTFIEFGITTSISVSSTFTPIGQAPPGVSYLPTGMTVGSLNFGDPFIAMTNDVNPSILETYGNRLFLAGISLAPSTVWFSEVAEPEGYQPDWNFEVRTNDADYVTAMRSYQSRLYIFKKNSFHVLSGDSPENFFLQEMSHQYGCLNKYCTVVYNDIMIFLDRKGLIRFNGSSIDSAFSLKVQPYFDQMNVAAAIDKARLVHDKLRNQILVALPIGSVGANNINNLTIIYDYVANAWSTQYGYNSCMFAEIQGRNDSRNVFYGSYSGTINWFGPSFTQDNGQGFTLYYKTPFIHDLGYSTQEQYRRLYLDANRQGATLGMPMKFYQDYGSSVVYSATFVLGAFQDRIDFGISAKALSYELFTLSQTSPLKISGFTIESRLQRRV